MAPHDNAEGRLGTRFLCPRHGVASAAWRGARGRALLLGVEWGRLDCERLYTELTGEALWVGSPRMELSGEALWVGLLRMELAGEALCAGPPRMGLSGEPPAGSRPEMCPFLLSEPE